jgi:hypothetical protein
MLNRFSKKKKRKRKFMRMDQKFLATICRGEINL